MYEYAIYRGDDLLVIGTKEECAEELGVNPQTINFYSTPSYHKRVAKRGNPDESLIGERIEIDESIAL